LQEKVGSALVPALLKVVDVFIADVLPAIDKVTAVVQRNWPMIQQTITEAVQKIVDFVTPIVGGLQALWENFGNNILSFVERVWPRIQQVIGGVLEIIRGIIKTVTSLIQGDWAGVWEGIKGIVSGAWTYIQGIVGAALEALRAIIGVLTEIIVSGIKAAWDGVVEYFKDLPGKLASAGAGMFDWIKEAFKSVMNWVIDKWNDFELKVNIPDAIPGLPDEFKVTTPNIPRFDNGGIVPGPRGAPRLILAHGGETVLPTHKTGAGVTINIMGNVDRSVLADTVYELRKSQLAMAG
jgi:phage-related protein